MLKAANVVCPRWASWPVPLMVAAVCDVNVKEPEKLPLKGVECEANTTGNVARTITPRTMDITTKFFKLILAPP